MLYCTQALVQAVELRRQSQRRQIIRSRWDGRYSYLSSREANIYGVAVGIANEISVAIKAKTCVAVGQASGVADAITANTHLAVEVGGGIAGAI